MADIVDCRKYVEAPRVSVPVEYCKRDLILYSLGIGSKDQRYTYEHHPEFAAFPTYPICLTFKGDAHDIVPFPPPVMQAFQHPPLHGVTVGLDAEKVIERVAEIPSAGAKLKLVGGIVGVHNKGKGALVESEFELQGEDGKVYYKILSSSFSVGAKNYKEFGKLHSETVNPPKTAPTMVVDMPTDPEIASLFRLSGDYNRLHVDEDFAKRSGMDKPIMHGLCNLGHTTRVVLDAVAGGDQRRFKSVQLRFASTVICGQLLTVEIWVSSPTEVMFRTLVKETGKVCISNGLLKLHPAASL